MKYFALLTTYGEKVLAEASALGTRIELTQMAVGDGGGSLPTPDTRQTRLVNEKRRAAINTLFIDPLNANQIIAEQVIPENEGGWWIREMGLFDKSGMLVAVANCPENYKPLLAEGSGRTQTIRMILIVSHTESVTLKIDPSVVLATRKYVDDAIQVLDRRITELTANDVGAVPITRRVNNKQLNTDITLNAGDVGAYTKAEADTKIADAKKAGTDAQATANAANTAATNANNNANSRVPNTRRVNNKPLSTDITLTAGDVGAYTKAEVDSRSVNLDAIYPIGIVAWFAQNKNPNTLFPNTKWQYLGENKTIRLANSNGSNVLTTGGADSIQLTEAQLPAHNHSFSATTSSFDYGTKSTNTTGAHTHGVNGEDSGSGGSNFGRGNGNTRTINGMHSAGNHAHTVAIGAHSHTVSGTTESKGSSSAINVTNAYIMLMGWYRVS
ncbi:phage tail protein [Providencia alcalifaciens]|uniref:phage tail-collar fiber domain-containing protein n=1 Tax=Providencia alcalifaciens TaxID=126385 RepID=UPI001E52E005|nr:phage tail protein [Providencia alcalifaciens]WGZ52809.1 phage tail protein [Providencia alcalifaciens]